MRISRTQIFWMIASMDLGMTLIMTLTPALQPTNQDAWLAVIAAGGIALLIAVIATKLALLYPEQTFIQFSQTILGKWPGRLVIVIYLVQWYTIIPIVLRQFTDLVNSLLLEDTPRLPVIIIMVLLTIYAVYSGSIEGIGRCSEVLGPLIMLMVVVVLAANLNNLTFSHILPVYADSGIVNILKGSLPPASYLGHAVEFVMLAAFLDQSHKGAKYTIWAVAAASFIVLLSIIMVILTEGPQLPTHVRYPFFEMTKEIQVGVIENLDALTVVIWISSVFIKLSIYLFIASYGTAQFLNIKNWKRLIWLISPMMILFAMIPENVTESTTHYLQNYWVPFVLPVNMILLPLLLLIVGKIKARKNAS